MIKLTILSGIKLAQSIDNFNRTPLHYATWNDIKHNNLFDVLIKCYNFQLSNKQDDLIRFISKAFKNDESEDDQVLTKDDVEKMMLEMNVKKSNEDVENASKKKFSGFKEALNFKDYDQRTILHYACIYNNFELVKIILNYSANPEEKDYENNVRDNILF